MRQELVIFVNGMRHAIRQGGAFGTLTEFLRRDLGLTGTKVVCAEGDCGSCTVLVGRTGEDGTICYRPVCGCILLLGQLDGAHVVTVEGLSRGGALNPVQESMVRCHGAQCGYCTPGFVVAMYAMLQHGARDEQALCRGLTGNLCRCTGYEPILRAAMETDVEAIERIDELYPPQSLVEQMVGLDREPVLIVDGARSFFKPVTIEQAVEFRAGNPGCAIVAGGTDLGVQVNKNLRRPEVVMSLLALPELRRIETKRDVIRVGATATLSQLQEAFAQTSEFAQYLEWFGSPQIRNAGTLAGNLANGSPIGDLLPPLFVLEAKVELASTAGRRVVDVNDFYTGYRRTVMRPDELIAMVEIPLPRADEVFRLYKVSKRLDLDISTFSAAIWMRLRDGRIIDCRLSYGGVGPTVVRLRNSESALRGKPLDEPTLASVEPIVQAEISTISDVRGSSEYRRLLAGKILRRFHAEMTGAGANGNGR
jgi:xanthine dehydrogenase small subunit